MKELFEIYKKSGRLHHAYAIQGDKQHTLPSLLKFLEKDFNIELKNNPDFSLQEYDTFTIDDGRDLQQRHFRRAISDKKIFIILTRFVTVEAQNALLKLFEEPTADTYLFIIIPNTQILLPTLRSRLITINPEITEDKSDIESFAINFLKQTPPNRLSLIKDIVEEKDKGKAIDFVTSIEKILATKLKSSPASNKNTIAKSIEEVLMAKKYLHDRAPSVKLLLEHLAITIQ